MINEDDLQVIIAKEEYKKGKKYLNSLPHKKKLSYSRWLVAASMLILISVVFYWAFWRVNTSPEKLYMAYFTDYPNMVTPVSRNTDSLTTKENIFMLYEKQQYVKAIKGFNKLLENSSLEDQQAINLYKAISLLNINKPNAAIIILQNNAKISARFKDKYLWYLSLAYLKKNDAKSAKSQLKLLSKEENNFKKEETLSLLKSLK